MNNILVNLRNANFFMGCIMIVYGLFFNIEGQLTKINFIIIGVIFIIFTYIFTNLITSFDKSLKLTDHNKKKRN